jgi:predicted permease
MKMPIITENEPFKNPAQVKTEIRNCDLFGGICQFACFAFAALGVIGDASKITLGLYSMSWFLLAIVAGLNAIIGHTHVVMAKHLLGVETESKKGNIELPKE